jgi:hypothetical protein
LPGSQVREDVAVTAEPQPGIGPGETDGPHGLSPSVRARLAEEAATADAIYGIIVSSAVMASVHGQGVLQLALATLFTLLIYWTAERFAHVMAQRIVHAPRLGWQELRRELGEGWELVTASFIPLAVLVGSRMLGATVSGAVNAALLCSTALLAAAGWRVGQEADLSLPSRLLSAAIGGAFGGAMIALKTLLH